MTEVKSCDGKMAFDSEQQAETAALMAYHQRSIKLKTYQCTLCELWHLASSV